MLPVFLCSLLKLLVAVNVVPSLLILFSLMMETITSSEMSAHTKPHGVTFENRAFFIVTAVTTSIRTYNLRLYLTDWLPVWSWALLERPPVVQQLDRFPSILWNLKVHYCVYKSSSLASIVIQTSLVQTTQSYFYKIHLNYIHPPRSWSS
jgi:hypothetical protein